jgi:hypothetical protein
LKRAESEIDFGNFTRKMRWASNFPVGFHMGQKKVSVAAKLSCKSRCEGLGRILRFACWDVLSGESGVGSPQLGVRSQEPGARR